MIINKKNKKIRYNIKTDDYIKTNKDIYIIVGNKKIKMIISFLEMIENFYISSKIKKSETIQTCIGFYGQEVVGRIWFIDV